VEESGKLKREIKNVRRDIETLKESIESIRPVTTTAKAAVMAERRRRRASKRGNAAIRPVALADGANRPMRPQFERETAVLGNTEIEKNSPIIPPA
jgi:hypothetical protein